MSTVAATTRSGVGSLAGGALQQNGSCAASFGTLQRGAAHAPGPVR